MTDVTQVNEQPQVDMTIIQSPVILPDDDHLDNSSIELMVNRNTSSKFPPIV